MTQNLNKQAEQTKPSIAGRVSRFIGSVLAYKNSDFDEYASGKAYMDPKDDAEGLGLSPLEVQSRLTETEKTAKATPIKQEINNREMAGRVLRIEGVEPESEDWNTGFAKNIESINKMDADKAATDADNTSADQTPKVQ